MPEVRRVEIPESVYLEMMKRPNERTAPDEALLETIVTGFEAAERELTDYGKLMVVRGGPPSHWPVMEIIDALKAIKAYRQSTSTKRISEEAL